MVDSSQPILDILQGKLIPWIREFGLQRFTVATSQARQIKLPADVTLTRKKLAGQRVGMRGRKDNLMSALWPKDALIESRVPQLVFVTDGQADLRFGNYVLNCTAGHYFFIPPEVPRMNGNFPHLEGENKKSGFCELFWLRPYDGQMQCWLCHSKGGEHYDAQYNERIFVFEPRLQRLFEEFWEEVTATSSRDDEICRQLLELFLLHLRRALRENRYTYYTAARQENVPSISGHQPILRAQEYIKNHMNEALTIEKVARMVHLSRTQFALRFREETGQTFTEFVTQCRMEQAKVLLRETDASIAYVSRLLGYKSVAYFYEVFKRQTGVLPSAFRQTQNANSE